jgi:hypothetical protein
MMFRRIGFWCGAVCLVAMLGAAGAFAGAQGKLSEVPRIVEKDGRFALLVDGEPYLMLGVQANNSSAWPAYLGKVWPAAETLHANTVELPVYWEQLEAEEGKFDFTVVDQMLHEAREHKLHLVLLWFGTWKNGSPHYAPEWVKADHAKYPYMRKKDGTTIDSLSPFGKATLGADETAFKALMRHLKTADAGHTVLMVQVENETGTWGAVRDYGADAEKAFAGAVPEKLWKALGKEPGSWTQVFGEDAEEFFHAWAVASYVGEIAAAGKAEYALPMYANAALRDPMKPGRPPSYESGGPTDNVLSLWKAAAPSLDVLAPDIYLPEYPKYIRALELYSRKDNPLMVPETGNPAEYARYVYAALGHGAIGWAPFGLDLTGYSNQPSGPLGMEASALKPFAREYGLLAPIAGKLARWTFEGKLKGTSEDPENHRQTMEFANWNAVVSYGMPSFGDWVAPKGNTPADGGVIMVQLLPDTFLVTGHHARVDFAPVGQAGAKRMFLKVEEVHATTDNGWATDRIWNGDQTDWGLNFKADEDVILRVKLGTY